MKKSLKNRVLNKILRIVGAKKVYEHKQYLSFQEKLNRKQVKLPIGHRRIWQKHENKFVFFESKTKSDKVILYTHGGAFVSGPNIFHWKFLKSLQKATGASILFPIYPKAPEFCHKDGYDFLFEVYDYLTKNYKNKSCFFAGDSAGGNIALSLAWQLKQKGQKLPKEIFLFSPCLDLTLSSPQIDQTEKDNTDPMLSKNGLKKMYACWAKDTPLDSPILSPFFADMSNMCKMVLFASTKEILYPECAAFAQKNAKVAQIEFVETEENHAWVLYPIKEALSAFDLIAKHILEK